MSGPGPRPDWQRDRRSGFAVDGRIPHMHAGQVLVRHQGRGRDELLPVDLDEHGIPRQRSRHYEPNVQRGNSISNGGRWDMFDLRMIPPARQLDEWTANELLSEEWHPPIQWIGPTEGPSDLVYIWDGYRPSAGGIRLLR